LDLGTLDPASLSKAKRSAVVEQVRAFVVLQQVDLGVKDRPPFLARAPRYDTERHD
jgi:hypothetical protein